MILRLEVLVSSQDLKAAAWIFAVLEGLNEQNAKDLSRLFNAGEIAMSVAEVVLLVPVNFRILETWFAAASAFTS
jgi:hypothetical protein